jgi:hypothetical protein
MAGSRGTSAGSLGSAEDSEFEELVAEGREEHPIVRYTRLVRDKKAELEYVYNPVRAEANFSIRMVGNAILLVHLCEQLQCAAIDGSSSAGGGEE